MFTGFKKYQLVIFSFVSLWLIGTSAIQVNRSQAASPSSLIQQLVLPFLNPPYPGTASEQSIFDHTRPNYSITDSLIQAFTGATANRFDCGRAPGELCELSDTVYWSSSLQDWLAYNGHDGIDYSMLYRPMLAAAESDQVVEARWVDPQNHKQGFGLFVKLHHSNRYQTLYGHLSAISVQACDQPGCTTLAQGQVIGISGNTGNSSGAHLHFGVYRPDGQVVDPYGWTSPDVDPWTSNQPQSLWVSYPSVAPSTTTTVLPSGDPLSNPLARADGMVVDDNDAGFSESPADCWTVATTAAGVSENNSMRYITPVTSGAATCIAQWNFPATLATGIYDAYVRIPAGNATSEGALYTISHAGQSSQAIVDQSPFPDGAFADGWVYIGQYEFSADGTEYIRLGNKTQDESNNAPNLKLAADAVQFVPLFNCSSGTEPGILSAHLDEQTGAVACDSSNRSGHSSGVAHNGAVTGASIISDGQLKQARHFNQDDGLDKITFAASDDYHLANGLDNSLTASLWFRHDGSNTGERTLANALGTSSGIFGGWKLTFDPATREVKFTVYSGDKNSTTPTTVATTIASGFADQWVHVKAIKDGADDKLYLCTALGTGSGVLSSGVSFSQGVYYWPGITLDLGVDYDGSTATGWQGDLDEFVYKDVADKSGCVAGIQTPAVTATPIAQGLLPSQENGGPAYVYINGLQPGATYRIVVTGTYYYGAYWGIADAQWSDWPSRDQCFCSANRAIYFNGVPLDAIDVLPADHDYTFLWTADSPQLQLYITDKDWSDNVGALNYTLFNDGDSYQTPTPITTGAGPTPLPTHAPTVVPPSCTCVLEWLIGRCIQTSSSRARLASLAQNAAVGVWQQAAIDIQLFTRIRDEVLNQTPEGQHYIELYNLYSPEIINALAADSALKDEAIAVLQLWQPNLQALAEGQGNTLTITAEEAQAAQTFLNHLGAAGSPALRQTIADEQAQRPLEQFVGKTMSQAWTVINQPATATPTMTSTATATPTLTDTPTPTPSSTLTPLPTDDAPNSREAATQISPKNVNLRYFLALSGDEDWFHFRLEQTGSPQVYLNNLPANYDLYLYDADGRLLGSSPKEAKAAEKITLTGIAPGDYYVRVIGVDGAADAFNSYQLRFSVPGTGGP